MGKYIIVALTKELRAYYPNKAPISGEALPAKWIECRGNEITCHLGESERSSPFHFFTW